MSGRIPYIEQSHHILSLFRQQSDAERRGLLAEMISTAKEYRDLATADGIEHSSATRIIESGEVMIGSAAPLGAWQLAHIAVDWGLLDLSRDLSPQFRKLRAVRAGKASGETRRQKAVTGWHGHALDLAKSIRAQNPSMSQRNLAAEIQALWKQAGDPPGFDSILNFVRSSEHGGTLTKRRTKEVQ